MYCGCCGKGVVIPDGFRGIPGVGCVQKLDDEDFVRVIRCVECANKLGVDLKFIYICIKPGDISSSIHEFKEYEGTKIISGGKFPPGGKK